ncbi:hypothetical protein EXIGLDRAFT_607087 [Exidia glandulosa HHB12029]|uniref:CsbD-like domain-containing protein n=1 Tax=Exidia glandulosa HHB12029 TaxID=1314781 RepID=A0A165LUK2_EXIGL|nr:hypothetical protein EXIGLDRAFT_607087 [Exidia glandulosa HHB12029]
MSSEPTKTNGQIKSVQGTATQLVGNVLGSEEWQASGQRTHAEGEAETKAAETKGYAEGTFDRVKGRFDNVVGAVTGDKTQQTKAAAREEKGKQQQNLNS